MKTGGAASGNTARAVVDALAERTYLTNTAALGYIQEEIPACPAQSRMRRRPAGANSGGEQESAYR